jgi:hypothetical protein
MQVPRDVLVVGVGEGQVADQLLGVLPHARPTWVERRPSIDRDTHGVKASGDSVQLDAALVADDQTVHPAGA